MAAAAASVRHITRASNRRRQQRCRRCCRRRRRRATMRKIRGRRFRSKVAWGRVYREGEWGSPTILSVPLRGKTHTPSRTPVQRGREHGGNVQRRQQIPYESRSEWEVQWREGAVWRRGDHPGHVEHFTSSSDGQHSPVRLGGRPLQ